MIGEAVGNSAAAAEASGAAASLDAAASVAGAGVAGVVAALSAGVRAAGAASVGTADSVAAVAKVASAVGVASVVAGERISSAGIFSTMAAAVETGIWNASSAASRNRTTYSSQESYRFVRVRRAKISRPRDPPPLGCPALPPNAANRYTGTTKNVVIGVIAILCWTAGEAQAAIRTFGIAQLPAQIEIVDSGGTKLYRPFFNSQEFIMSDDEQFQMGSTTMCDPNIGRTKVELQIPLDVKDRVDYLNPDELDPRKVKKVSDTRHLGKALLIVPAGTSTYGRCQNTTINLQALTFDHPPAGKFEIRWEAK